MLQVLLFVIVMAWLSLNSTENVLLATKTSHNFHDKNLAFAAAEAGLLREQAIIQNKTMLTPAMEAKIITTLNLISEDTCHKKRYQIISRGQYRQAQVTLEVIYDYLPESENKCSTEKINQRVLWREFLGNS